MCSPHCVPCQVQNEIGYGKIGCLKGYPRKGNPNFASHGKLYITWL